VFSIRLRQARPIPLDLNLDLNPGELHALVGPSGSGKSTVLRCIAGLHHPENGAITGTGRPWLDTATRTKMPAYQRRIGFVFQSFALFPHLSARDNIVAALGRLPREQRNQRAEQLLGLVRLSGLGERLPSQLSGGQQQRVAVARALAREPEILLLDEPFSAVDQATRTRLHRELALLRTQLTMPILLVTHDLDEAMMLADRMTVLHRGQGLATATPQQLASRPPSTEVARLLGHRNIFAGRITDDGRRLDWAGRRLEVAATGSFAGGDHVMWLIPPSSVLVHRRDRPSRGERENPVSGQVVEAITLGEQLHCTLEIDGTLRIAFSMSTHAARRNGIDRGVEATVSLLADGIHLMPA